MNMILHGIEAPNVVHTNTLGENINDIQDRAGWGAVEGSRVLREHCITPGRLQGGFGKNGEAVRAKAEIADYVLVYRNTKLAVIEAKAWDKPLTEGVGQAKNYAAKLGVRHTYATNGQGVYGIDMVTGTEGELAGYPTPDELWRLTFALPNAWRERFAAVPFEDKAGRHATSTCPAKTGQDQGEVSRRQRESDSTHDCHDFLERRWTPDVCGSISRVVVWQVARVLQG